MLVHTDEWELNCISPKWEGPVVIYVTNKQFGNASEAIHKLVKKQTEVQFTFCELSVNDWDRYLTPWESDLEMNGRVFRGKAKELLCALETQMLPAIRKCTETADIYLVGYSLAGLFALWSVYESDAFTGAASCSGSLWYPGWQEYACGHVVKGAGKVYLSLGIKEKNTGNPVMKSIEENTKLQNEILRKDQAVKETTLVWHEGGHFHQTEERVARGIKWLIEN